MRIRFEYNYKMEYCLTTYSYMFIKGLGEWNVAEDELSIEYSKSKCKDFKYFIEDYFDGELDIDSDCIHFNEEDLNELKKYCINNEN